MVLELRHRWLAETLRPFGRLLDKKVAGNESTRGASSARAVAVVDRKAARRDESDGYSFFAFSNAAAPVLSALSSPATAANAAGRIGGLPVAIREADRTHPSRLTLASICYHRRQPARSRGGFFTYLGHCLPPRAEEFAIAPR
jgi:hypothetical protein